MIFALFLAVDNLDIGLLVLRIIELTVSGTGTLALHLSENNNILIVLYGWVCQLFIHS